MIAHAPHPLSPGAGAPDDIRLVRVDLDAAAPLTDGLFDVLSDEERAAAARFRQPADVVRSAATRAVLRLVLAAELGAQARSLAFVRSDRGRPALAMTGEAAAVDFNVAHSGDVALIAWSRRRRVGVDVEVLRGDRAWRPLGRMVLGPADARHLEAADDEGRREALFYAVWVAKEALLKAEGRGITDGMNGFSVLSDEARRPLVAGDGPVAKHLSGYAAAWIDDIPGHAACLAWGPGR